MEIASLDMANKTALQEIETALLEIEIMLDEYMNLDFRLDFPHQGGLNFWRPAYRKKEQSHIYGDHF